MTNLLAHANSLEVQGKEHVKVYRATVTKAGEEPNPSKHERHFCRECGTHLWAYNPEYPKLLHPVASSLDTQLPSPPSLTHMFMRSKPDWLRVDIGENDTTFETYPDEWLQTWHRRHGLLDE